MSANVPSPTAYSRDPPTKMRKLPDGMRQQMTCLIMRRCLYFVAILGHSHRQDNAGKVSQTTSFDTAKTGWGRGVSKGYLWYTEGGKPLTPASSCGGGGIGSEGRELWCFIDLASRADTRFEGSVHEAP